MDTRPDQVELVRLPPQGLGRGQPSDPSAAPGSRRLGALNTDGGPVRASTRPQDGATMDLVSMQTLFCLAAHDPDLTAAGLSSWRTASRSGSGTAANPLYMSFMA